jgi:2'-5' RNA ligase
MSSIHVHSERSARTGIAIVWPAWFEGSTDPELHATALFLGSTETVDFTKEDVEAVVKPYLWPAWTKVTGLEMFGQQDDIPVLTLENTRLLTITRMDINERLKRRGIKASTTFDFNPHVTISKEAEHVQSELFWPKQIHLESPVLWWGSDRAVHTNHDMRKLRAVV